MKEHPLSEPDMRPPAPVDLTPGQSVALWADLMNTCEQFVLAGLRREIGPEGDLKAAYRAWYAGQMEEHDRTMRHMLEELSRRSAGDDG